jgi:hypothetical protein
MSIRDEQGRRSAAKLLPRAWIAANSREIIGRVGFLPSFGGMLIASPNLIAELLKHGSLPPQKPPKTLH